MVKTFIASNPASLRAALSTFVSTATVEAEFGAECVEGSVLTLAHHGPRSGNPAPCLASNIAGDFDACGVSHLDLDALGGWLALQGRKPDAESFWALATFVDVAGPHRLGEAKASTQDLARLQAWFAWSETNRCYAPRDGSALDVSEAFEAAAAALCEILAGDPAMIAAGEAHRLAGEKLNEESFRQTFGRVIYRRSDSFVNHIYTSPSGEVCEVVVAYNPKQGSITVSFANPGVKDNACAFVQGLWGSLAGGHKGIAGSPRGQKMTRGQAVKAAKSLAVLMSR